MKTVETRKPIKIPLVRNRDIDGNYDLDGVSQTPDFDVVIASAKSMPTNPIVSDIERTDREKVAHGLQRFLADSYTLYLMTSNFHWNVTGPHFRSLHLMFEEQYQDLAAAIDTIAERIRALGFPVIATFADFSQMTSIKEYKGEQPPSAEEMIKKLRESHETIVRTLRQVVPLAEEARDFSTEDLLIQRMQYHEKTAWMLRSLQG